MTVSVLLVRSVVEPLEARGVSLGRLCEAARFDPARLADAEGRIEPDELWRFDQAAVSLTGDPALGLRLGEHAHPQGYNLIGYLTAQAATLRQAIDNLMRFARMLSTDSRKQFEEHGDTALLKLAWPPGAPPVAARLRRELAMTGFYRLVQYFGGGNARVTRVCFEYAAPPYASEYRRVFGGSERFEEPFTGIEFDRELLDRTQLHRNEALHAALEAEAERNLRRLFKEASTTERLVEHLESASWRGRVKMVAAARHLGMSVRSLRRRLAEEGVSFAELAEGAQSKVAKQMLTDPNRTVHETALTLGFSDAATFHRAFKRWTGVTPSRYRTTR